MWYFKNIAVAHVDLAVVHVHLAVVLVDLTARNFSENLVTHWHTIQFIEMTAGFKISTSIPRIKIFYTGQKCIKGYFVKKNGLSSSDV
jgi:hypothetical protein